VTPGEAARWLQLAGDAGSRRQVRLAYLRLVRTTRLEADPERFWRLREAFELLERGPTGAEDEGGGEAGGGGEGGAAARAWPVVEPSDAFGPYRDQLWRLPRLEQLELARQAVRALPGSVEARWTLLSFLKYGVGPEAFDVLSEGVASVPEEFLDELLLHFSPRVAPHVLSRAERGAGSARLMLVAGGHADQGRPAEADRVLRTALEMPADWSVPARFWLAWRPVFSLLARGQNEAAAGMLDLLRRGVGADALATVRRDHPTAMILDVADELARLGREVPLELRQAAADAAKHVNFEHAATEARFAIRVLPRREVRRWQRRLAREAPVLAKVLGLDLTDEQLRPRGSPRLLIPVPWLTLALAVIVAGAFFVRRMTDNGVDRFLEKTSREVTDQLIKQAVTEEMGKGSRGCPDPSDPACLPSRSPDGASGHDTRSQTSGPAPDAGIALPVLGEIRAPLPHRRKMTDPHERE
jgi:hypothetical protein